MTRHMERSTIRSRIASYLHHRRLHKGKISVLAFIGAIITLGVVLSLMQHGMAAQHEETVLDCHYIGEVAHTHNSSCYNAAGELVCPLRERELHTHNDSCYQRQLICGLEESEGHKHTDACYKDVLVCGKDELTEEHVHGEGCFKTIMVNNGETSPDAAPTDAIVTGDSADKDGASSSASSDATDDQSADTPADPTKPEQSMKKQLKDADGKTVITVEAKAPAGALSEGAKMSLDWANKNDIDMKQVQDAITARDGGKLLDSQAVHIAFTDGDGKQVTPDKDIQVTITSKLLGEDKDAAKVVRVMPAEEGIEGAKPTYEVVDQLDKDTISTRKLTLKADQVAFDASKFATFVVAPVTDKLTMRSELEGARVRVDVPAGAGIPKGSTLKVAEITKGDGGYDNYKKEALSKVEVKHTTLARFFDITIVGPDGSEIQPEEPVRVRIKVADAPAADPEPDVLHFDAEGSAERVNDVEVAKNIAGFDAKSFSVYGVVYTVDFSYDVDGETFKTSVKGGQVINLKGLLLSLHVAEKDDLNDFVAAIRSVEFSNEDLVKVIRVDNDTTAGEIKEANGINPEYSADLAAGNPAKLDAAKFTAPNYALASLKPFNSDETLTITMDNGNVFTIAVSDESTMPTMDDPDSFYVKKEWNSVEDVRDFPEVRFTLYQGPLVGGKVQQGTVFNDGTRDYTDIPLNTDNKYSWKCPVDLPTSVGGQPVGYYVVENHYSADNNNRSVNYQNSTRDDQGFIINPGAEIPFDGGKEDVERYLIFDYTNTNNSNTARRNDQEEVKGSDGTITGKNGESHLTGSLTIWNRSGDYMQMDVKKKWLVYRGVEGRLCTETTQPPWNQNCIIKYVLMRRPCLPGAGPGEFCKDTQWEDYGNPAYVGYQNGQPVELNTENKYDLKMTGQDWNFSIAENDTPQAAIGLPRYGFWYDKEAKEVKRVYYDYICREIGVFADFDENPFIYHDPDVDVDFEFMYDFIPECWPGDGPSFEVWPRRIAQDQDRLANAQATDLRIQKDWDGQRPSDVDQVFVKIFRQPKNATGDDQIEDVTNLIGARHAVAYGYGQVDELWRIGWRGSDPLHPDPVSDIGGYLMVDADGTPLTVHGLMMTLPQDASASLADDKCYYWVKEIGYRKSTGEEVFTAEQLDPHYTKWIPTGKDSGSWDTTKYDDPKDAKILIDGVGRNRFMISNKPATDLRVRKVFIGANGNRCNPREYNVNPPIDHVLFKVKRTTTVKDPGGSVIDTKSDYLTFDYQGDVSDTLDLVYRDEHGWCSYVSAKSPGSNEYQVDDRVPAITYRPDYGIPGAGYYWKVPILEHMVQGLESLTYDPSTGYTSSYSYDIEEAGFVDFAGTAFGPEDMRWSHAITTEPGTGVRVITNSIAGITVGKKWTDASGQTLNPNKPWDSSIHDVKFSVNQVRWRVIFDEVSQEWVRQPNPTVTPIEGLQDLTIEEANKVIYVAPDAVNVASTNYSIVRTDTPSTAEQQAMVDAGVSDWGLKIIGLEKETPRDFKNPCYDLSYEVVEKPIDHCITTYDPANTDDTAGEAEIGGTVNIKNKRDSIKITFGKTFVGLDDVLDGLTTDDIKDNYDDLSDDVKKLLNIKLKLVNVDDPLPPEAGSSATIFEMSLKDLVQKELATYDAATKTISGTVDNTCTVEGVNAQAILSDSAFDLTESGQDQSANIPSGFAFKQADKTKDPTSGKADEDGKLSIIISNTYVPQIDVDLFKVDIDDLDERNPSKTLTGAEFELWKYKEVEGGEPYSDGLDPDFGTGGKKAIPDGTPLDGKFKLEGLKPGHYELHEIAVPGGYIKMDGDPRFEVAYDSTAKRTIVLPGDYMHDESTPTPSKDDIAFLVDYTSGWRIIYGNPPGSELPHAGGSGTVASTVAGVAMAAGAALYLASARKRREAEARK